MSNGNDRCDSDNNFSLCYAKYFRLVVRFLKNFVSCNHISEELSQDVFVKLYERNKELDPESPTMVNFLFTVASNTAIDYLRRKKNEARKYQQIHLDEVVMDRKFYEELDDAWIRGEVISTLHDTIDSFPEEQRDLFVRKRLLNETTASIRRSTRYSHYRIQKIEEEIEGRIRENLKEFFDE